MTARTLFVDRVVELIDEGTRCRGADCASAGLVAARGSGRIGEESGLRVTGLPPGRGAPQTPADLAHLDAIIFSRSGSPAEWSFASGETDRSADPAHRQQQRRCDCGNCRRPGPRAVLSYQIAPELRVGKARDRARGVRAAAYSDRRSSAPRVAERRRRSGPLSISR